MPIHIIQQKHPDPRELERPGGKRMYKIVVGGKVIAKYEHARANGLAACLRKAANAVDAAVTAGAVELEFIPPKKRRGKALTTGKYATREKLVERIWFFWRHTGNNQTAIARITGVSLGTVGKILDGPAPPEDEIIENKG